MHGMIMVIYLLTALFLGGFGNYLIPLMVGARDMVFPYVNMVSYWVYLFAVLLLVASFFVPGGPTGAGWTLYPPQAILSGTPGANWGIILMLVSLAFFIIGFTMGGLNYVVTVLQARTRGMTLMRLPLTVWGIFMATILALLAFPALFVSAIMMTLDHTLGTSFFMPALVSQGQGARPQRRQPGVVPAPVLVLRPSRGLHRRAAGVRHRLGPASASTRGSNIFGYRMMVWAILAIGGLSFVVWAHHMYVSGMNPYFGFFFATTTLIIAVPTALKVYNWVLTLWRGNIHLTVPMLFAIGFVFTFINGGLTGLFLGNVTVERAAVRHDVRGRALPHGDGGVADPGGVRGDLPLVPQDHRPHAERYDGQDGTSGSRSSAPTPSIFRCTTSASSACRAGTSPSRARTSFPNRRTRSTQAITIAALIVGVVQLVFLYNLVWSYFKGKPSGGNPWRATTLEWQTPDTPPKHGNFGPSYRSSIAGRTTTACPAPRRTSFRRTSRRPRSRRQRAPRRSVMTTAMVLLSAIMAVVVGWLVRQTLNVSPWQQQSAGGGRARQRRALDGAGAGGSLGVHDGRHVAVRALRKASPDRSRGPTTAPVPEVPLAERREAQRRRRLARST